MDSKITRLRKLLSDAIPDNPEPARSAEQDRIRAFEYYEFNVGLPVVKQSDRARALREIARIATWRGWAAEVTRAMDREGVEGVGEMSDAGVFKLCARLRALEDAAMTGCEADQSETW